MDVDKHIEKAEEALKRRNYDFAINLYQQILLINPNNLKARKGFFEASLKNYDRKRAGKGAKAKKGRSNFGSTLSIFMRSGGRKDPAIIMSACDKVISRNPRDSLAHEKLGYAASKAGHLEAAIFAFEKVLEFQPNSLQAAKNLGRLHHRVGNILEALESYDRALKIKPGDQESIKARKDLAAEAAIKGHGYAEAKSTMDLLKDKDQIRDRELTERVVLDDSEVLEAIQKVREKLASDSDNKKLLMKLGELLEQKGDLSEAEEVFGRLSILEPTNFDHKERMGDLKIRMAEERVLQLEKEGGNTEELEAAGRALQDLKIQEYALRVEEHPTDLPQRYRYGVALFQVGRLDDAVSEFQKTVKDPRKRLDSQVMMASAFQQKGMLDLAENQLLKALEVAGEGTRRAMEIRYDLGTILEEQGKVDEARAQYTQVYERDINFRDIKVRLESLQKKSS